MEGSPNNCDGTASLNSSIVQLQDNEEEEEMPG
jgi:hypothetical protein